MKNTTPNPFTWLNLAADATTRSQVYSTMHEPPPKFIERAEALAGLALFALFMGLIVHEEDPERVQFLVYEGLHEEGLLGQEEAPGSCK